MRLVAGVDSSTQSCTVIVVDADDGTVVRRGVAPHPDSTQVDPERWWDALQAAIAAAGGLDDVEAVSIAGQQHGLVALDAEGALIRPALLWNDTRSAAAAADLVDELGARTWADATGCVPVASFTVSKMRWLADHEPANAQRLAAVALPHDWLTWRLRGTGRIEDLVTDRSDASGTGYLGTDGSYRRDLLAHALRRSAAGIVLPRVLGPSDGVCGASVGGASVGGAQGYRIGAGCGDNAGAALGLGLRPGQVSVSLGTSGVVAAVSSAPTRDESGLVAGFADATGNFLPLACTLNGARVLDATAALLGVDHDGLADLALKAPPGCDGLTLVPYLEGERTPNLPDSTGTLSGLTLATMTPAHLARAAVEGLWCSLALAVDAVRSQGVKVSRAALVGGAARSEAVRQIGPSVLGLPIDVPELADAVAVGAARQAAWMLSGDEAPPTWPLGRVQIYEAEHRPAILDRFRAAAAGLVPRISAS